MFVRSFDSIKTFETNELIIHSHFVTQKNLQNKKKGMFPWPIRDLSKPSPVTSREHLTWFYRDGHPRLKRLRAGHLRSVVDVHAQVVANVVGAEPPRSLTVNQTNKREHLERWITTNRYEEFSVFADSNIPVWTKVVAKSTESTEKVLSCTAEETFMRFQFHSINMEMLTRLATQNCCCFCCLTKLDGSKMNWLRRCDCGRYT